MRLLLLALPGLLVILGPGVVSAPRNPAPEPDAALAATCRGATPCKACRTCSDCRHCSKEGGKCGICKK